MKNSLTWVVSGILCLTLSGCVTVTGPVQNYMDDMIYSAKCVGADNTETCKAKAKQDSDNYQQSKNGGLTPQAAAASTSSDSSDVCKKIETTGPIDVDTAYIRAMKTFHFTTQEEFTSRVQFQGGVVNPNFKHVRTPGVMYDLWDFIDIPGFKGVHPMAGLQLSKSGAKGTLLEVEYCLSHNNSNVSNQPLWDAADKAFRSLVM